MTSSAPAIRREIEINQGVLSKAIKKYEDISALLTSSHSYLVLLTKVITIAAQHEEFTLVSRGSLMRSKEFGISLVQIVSEGCSSLMAASDKFYEIRMNALRLLHRVGDMIAKIEDSYIRKQIAEQIIEEAQVCADVAVKVMKEFEVINLAADQIVNAMYTTYNSNVPEGPAKALRAAIIEIRNGQRYIDNMFMFFSNFAILIKVDLLGDAAELSSVATAQQVSERHFADKAARLSVTSVQIMSVALVYTNVINKVLMESTRALWSLIIDFKCNEFLPISNLHHHSTRCTELEQMFSGSGEKILEKVANSKLELEDRIKDEITHLKK